jgi:hypothetical protein
VDYADDDAVTSFERWEKALEELAKNWETSPMAITLLGDSQFVRMKREAVINAARQEGDEHLPRLQKAFPGLDLFALVHALRVKVVLIRLGGE